MFLIYHDSPHPLLEPHRHSTLIHEFISCQMSAIYLPPIVTQEVWLLFHLSNVHYTLIMNAPYNDWYVGGGVSHQCSFFTSNAITIQADIRLIEINQSQNLSLQNCFSTLNSRRPLKTDDDPCMQCLIQDKISTSPSPNDRRAVVKPRGRRATRSHTVVTLGEIFT